MKKGIVNGIKISSYTGVNNYWLGQSGDWDLYKTVSLEKWMWIHTEWINGNWESEGRLFQDAWLWDYKIEYIVFTTYFILHEISQEA